MTEFEGTSTVGDFHEALATAIAEAKRGLTTDYIEWKLKVTRGENGGVVLKNHLTVTIEARGPATEGK